MNYERSKGGIFLPKQDLLMAGRWDCQLRRDGRIIDEWADDNLIVDEGLNAVLDIMFHTVTQIATWYIAVFEGNYTPVPTVTAATISAASTECTAYDEATRQEFNETAAVAKSINNTASRATFTFNATKTIYGAFLISNSGKGATSGTLFSAARFAASKPVQDNDQLLVSYTLNASSV